jgi:hypothetical protein
MDDKVNELSVEGIRAAMHQVLDHAVKEQTVTEGVAHQFKRNEFPPGQCIKSAYVASKRTTEYTQVRYKTTKYYVHRIAYRYGNNGALILADAQVSHLCHEPRCFNPKHLTQELGNLNRERACCRRAADEFQDYRCPHLPTCPDVLPCKEKRQKTN